jgi:hypothetical protein
MVMLERSTGLQFWSDEAEPLTMRGTVGVKPIWGSPSDWFCPATPQPQLEQSEKECGISHGPTIHLSL